MKYFKIKIGNSIMYVAGKNISAVILNDINNEEDAKPKLYPVADYIIDTSIKSRIVKNRHLLDMNEERLVDLSLGEENILGTINLRDGIHPVISATQPKRPERNRIPLTISEMYEL